METLSDIFRKAIEEVIQEKMKPLEARLEDAEIANKDLTEQVQKLRAMIEACGINEPVLTMPFNPQESAFTGYPCADNKVLRELNQRFNIPLEFLKKNVVYNRHYKSKNCHNGAKCPRGKFCWYVHPDEDELVDFVEANWDRS